MTYKQSAIFREKDTSVCWFSCGASILVELEFGNVSFFILVSESENTHHSFQNLSEASMTII